VKTLAEAEAEDFAAMLRELSSITTAMSVNLGAAAVRCGRAGRETARLAAMAAQGPEFCDGALRGLQRLVVEFRGAEEVVGTMDGVCALVELCKRALGWPGKVN